MTEEKLTLGKAIDQIIEALTSFEDNDRKAIINTVCQHLKIGGAVADRTGHEAQQHSASSESDKLAPAPAREANRSIDIKSLKEEKNPKSARQMACLVAFYLQEHAPESERKDAITTADVERYFKQASYKLPTKLEQLLIDSKHAGYFDSPRRGEYVLTRVGYNLVAHSMSSKAGNQA
jgi:hypothetical protein